MKQAMTHSFICSLRLSHGPLCIRVQLVPHRVEALDGTRILAVSAGLAHTVCLAADQTVYSFGFARSWLGHGDWQEVRLHL